MLARTILLPVSAAFALSLLACGGNEPAPATPATSTSATPTPETAHKEGGHDEHGGEHGAMSPALHDFHETLAPIWHATPGAERTGKACTGTKDLSAKAAAVGDAELTADVDAVKAACDSKGDVEGKMSVVHDRFHKLVEKK